LILSDLAGRPPDWLFLISALILLFSSAGAVMYRWTPPEEQNSDVLRALGHYLDLTYEFGGGDAGDHRTATIFGSASQAQVLQLLPAFRELKLGAAFRGARKGYALLFGELTTIPPRKLGQNTKRLRRDFLLLIVDLPGQFEAGTVCFAKRGIFGGFGQNAPYDGVAQGLALGNAAFERRFEIFAQNAHEARACLAPAFMEHILQTYQLLRRGEQLSFAFSEGRFWLSIETPEPWFDLTTQGAMAMDDPRNAEVILARMEIIADIAGSLGQSRQNSD